LANHSDNFRDIRLSTAEIIFVGTSHQESDATIYNVWLAQAIEHDKTLLKSLKRNNSTLNKIAQDFDANHNTTNIVCFYKDKDMLYKL